MEPAAPPAEAPTRCAACGGELPPYARFCAFCGAAQPHPTAAPPAARAPGAYPLWLTILFWVGAAFALLVAVIYAAIAVSPALSATSGLDPETIRTTALVAGGLAAALFAVQAIASVGMALGREWARTPATIASVGWALTCVGLPLAVVSLLALWRRPTSRGSR